MHISLLKEEQYEQFKQLFLDVFSNEPWFDKWDSDEQLDQYMKELTGNNNSLALVLYDENGEMVAGSVGYVYSWWQGREYFIKEFFVTRHKQNQGVGSIFIERINEYLKNEDIKYISLTTDRGTPAYDFYQKNKFNELKDNVFLFRKID